MTEEQWATVNPSPAQSRYPVCRVNWNHCREFAQKLSAKTGKTFRLPTEAEWEYACRAGTTSEFCFGDRATDIGAYAWFDANANGSGQAVGLKKPNAWGLHDMVGNLWEWCADWYGAYEAGAVTDPAGPPSGTLRVRRGGCWQSPPVDCRSACRKSSAAAAWTNTLGFRLVLHVEPPAASTSKWPFDAAEAKRRQQAAADALGPQSGVLTGRARQVEHHQALGAQADVLEQSGDMVDTTPGPPAAFEAVAVAFVAGDDAHSIGA